MIELVLTAAAITLVFVRGSIFAPVRSRGPAIWQELASCALCSGFWIGMGCYALLQLDDGRGLHWPVRECFAAGALTAAASLMLLRALEVLEALADWLQEHSE